MVLIEEVIKAVIILRRFISRKWIHDLVNFTDGESSASFSSSEVVP